MIDRCCFFIFILFLSAFGNVIGDGDKCTKEDLNIIEKCYKNHVFYDSSEMFPFNQLTFSMVYRFEYSPKNACAVKESLDKCMDKSVVKRCFNADDLQMIEFVNDLTVVEKITLTYFEMDYICGDVYQAVLENINCTNIHSTKQYNASKQNHFCDIESVTNFIAYEHFHACSESYRPILKKITAFSNCFSKRVCHFCDNLIKESLANLPDSNNSGNLNLLNVFALIVAFLLIK